METTSTVRSSTRETRRHPNTCSQPNVSTKPAVQSVTGQSPASREARLGRAERELRSRLHCPAPHPTQAAPAVFAKSAIRVNDKLYPLVRVRNSRLIQTCGLVPSWSDSSSHPDLPRSQTGLSRTFCRRSLLLSAFIEESRSLRVRLSVDSIIILGCVMFFIYSLMYWVCRW